jgi:hypothetical protein
MARSRIEKNKRLDDTLYSFGLPNILYIVCFIILFKQNLQ